MCAPQSYIATEQLSSLYAAHLKPPKSYGGVGQMTQMKDKKKDMMRAAPQIPSSVPKAGTYLPA